MMTEITERLLLEAGFKKQLFFYRISGIENDREIFVRESANERGTLAITKDLNFDRWYMRPFLSLNYNVGFGLDSATQIKFIEDIPS